MPQEPGAECFIHCVRQGDQKVIGETGEQVEFLAALSGPGAGTLHCRITFPVAPHEFELPPTSIADHDAPEIIDDGHRLGCQQMPGLLAGITPSNDQRQGVGIVQNRDGENSCLLAPVIEETP